MKFGWKFENEILQGRLAMLGIVAAMGSYLYSGQVIPGLW